MRQVLEIYQWLWKRLPRRFSIPLTLFTLATFFYILPKVTRWLTAKYDCVLQSPSNLAQCFGAQPEVSNKVLRGIADMILPPIFGIVMLVCVLLGLLLSYSLAVLVYSLIRSKKFKELQIHGPVKPHSASAAATIPASVTSVTPVASSSQNGGGHVQNPLARYHNIGIILAGGGAKGAYQAGAMKAIYEFLEENDAHSKVRMIAGTSIGSWNALFWLADLIKEPSPDKRSLLEQWWNLVDVKRVIQPTMYYPLFQNYLLSNEPWREAFKAIFGRQGNEPAHDRLLYHIQNPDAADALHFYFTRSNVARAQLEFTTNRIDLGRVPPHMRTGPRPRPPVPHDTCHVARNVDDIENAVFSSMDLPPLFPYSKAKDDDRYYEDGGVIDNLPIRFGTEIDKCDLLFVLPLNANFEEEVDVRSISKRLFRVLNVRQGILERNAFKLVYLYNELAALRMRADRRKDALEELLEEDKKVRASGSVLSRERIETIIRDGLYTGGSEVASQDDDGQSGAPEESDEVGVGVKVTAATRAANRDHQMVQVFSICPAPKLLINTADFWKTSEAGRAFRLMWEYTWSELEKFDFTSDPDWVRLAQVSPFGSVTYLEDF